MIRSLLSIFFLLAVIALPGSLSAQAGYATPKVEIGDHAPAWGPFDAYLKKMTTSVQRQWERVITVTQVLPAVGSIVEIKFLLGADGKISKIPTVSGRSGAGSCVKSISDRAPYGKWTPEMISALGSQQEITLRFTYQ